MKERVKPIFYSLHWLISDIYDLMIMLVTIFAGFAAIEGVILLGVLIAMLVIQ